MTTAIIGERARDRASNSQAISFDSVQQLRPRMMSVAYRMLGSVVDAEDAVQDAFLRLHSAVDVSSPEGFLVRTTTRLCIDQIRANHRRTAYIGQWIPEPVDTSDPSRDHGMDESLSQGFLLLLERLSSIERAAFVLRSVFDYEFSEIAGILEKSETHVRKIVSRAKAHLAQDVPRFRPTPEQANELAEQFVAACRVGDKNLVERLLTDDVEVYSDGGGKATAARVVIRSRELVARFMAGVFHKKMGRYEMHLATVNGNPGVYFTLDGVVKNVVSLGVERGIRRVYFSVNPDKLTRWSIAKIN